MRGVDEVKPGQLAPCLVLIDLPGARHHGVGILGRLVQRLGRTGRDMLDLVGFDMCLMAQYEVALELQGLTSVLVASQATEPGDGWPYDRVLPEFSDRSATTTGVAARIVEQFDGYYREREEAITTLAAYDLAHLPLFSERFDRLLAKLEPKLPELWPLVSRSIFFAEGYAPRTELQKSSNALASIDLVDAFRRMELNTRRFPAAGELRALENALDKLLITHKTSPLRRLSNGIAIYAPVTAAVLNEGYDELAINAASRWRHFVGRLHGLQAAASQAPVIRDLTLVDWKAERPVQEALPLNTHGVSYVVEGRDLLWLRGLRGQWDKTGEGLLVSHRASIVDANWSVRARDTAADRIDLMIPQFTDGTNSLVTQLDGYRYLVYGGEKAYYATVEEAGDYILVPILFHHPEAGDLGGTIYFHPQWWYPVAVELELPQPDGSIVYRQIKPEAAHEITLLFEYLKKDGTLSYQDVEFQFMLENLEDIYGKSFVVADSALLHRRVKVGVPYENWKAVKEMMGWMLDIEVVEMKENQVSIEKRKEN